jgi:flavin reductase (DIM6/NTAB) family NADH-FMN oxidoreductase RutF
MFELVNPRETVVITSRAEVSVLGKKIHKDNALAVDWQMPLSFSPRMFGIAIGKTRFSYKLIASSKVFVVNYLPFEEKDKVLFCGRNSGEHIDKLKKAGLEIEEADTIDCCRIKDSLGYLECKVVEEVETGDHVLFIAEVTKFFKERDGRKVFHVKDDKFTTTSINV